jgi:hypothetical protein
VVQVQLKKLIVREQSKFAPSKTKTTSTEQQIEIVCNGYYRWPCYVSKINEIKTMLTLNFDAATEQALNALAQTEERSIEQVLIEALQLYRDAEKLENQELNQIADKRLNDGQAFIRVSLNDL